MKEAYDHKALLEGLKGKGLDLAEDAALIIIDELFVWLEDSAKKSSTPYDDMALIILPQLKEIAKQQADKIDGKDEI